MAITAAEYEAAIRAVLAGGQEYTLPNGERVRHANLGELTRLRDEAAAREQSGHGGGAVFMPVAMRRQG
jgi:hypothetical protein